MAFVDEYRALEEKLYREDFILLKDMFKLRLYGDKSLTRSVAPSLNADFLAREIELLDAPEATSLHSGFDRMEFAYRGYVEHLIKGGYSLPTQLEFFSTIQKPNLQSALDDALDRGRPTEWNFFETLANNYSQIFAKLTGSN